ncbi:MAG: HAMP domain-containing sensor histidine kinase [Proteobacteria bacterium]|nr:HAMP domain-containing sensor histidine kinase [Pseudomonadota bacterium]
MTQNRYTFPIITAAFFCISVVAMYAVFGTLSDARQFFRAPDLWMAVDLTRTENLNATYQNAAKSFFLNPTEKQKMRLKHLNGVLKNRRNLLVPKQLKEKFPEEIKKSLKEETGYFFDALTQLSRLQDKPGLLTAEQKEIETHLASLNASMAYIFTESITVFQGLRNRQRVALDKLFKTIVVLSAFFVAALLALIYFMLKFQNQSKQLTYESGVKDQFFSIIAHDLMSPFTSLLGFTQMMAQSAENLTKDKTVEYANDANKAAERVYVLLRNLLEWSQLQMTGATVERDKIQLGRLVQETLEILKPDALKKDIRLINDVTDAVAFADREMTKTVIRNLIGNALKFTPQGGSIKISSTHQGDETLITVGDTGIGIPKEHLDKLFLLDQKTSTTGTGGEIGTGLGLPLCKDMLERNGGRIWVESTFGKGSQFHFTLPTESREG